MSRRDGQTTAGFSGGGQVLVGSYRDYADAERAVDHLSDNRFPVERTAIVGRGLTSVERVTGRLTTGRAAGQSAISGAVLGALFGWLFGLFNWVDPLIAGLLLALYGALIGAVAGALIGMAAHALTGGRRDFSSVGELRADSYDLLVDAAHAIEAGRLLDAEGGPGRGGDPVSATDGAADETADAAVDEKRDIADEADRRGIDDDTAVNEDRRDKRSRVDHDEEVDAVVQESRRDRRRRAHREAEDQAEAEAAAEDRAERRRIV
ncbi:hypothetical protein GCM10009853_016270 [Glycomyces scopariae]